MRNRAAKKPTKASNIFPIKKNDSEDPETSPKKSFLKSSEGSDKAPKIPEKPCLICNKPSLCWGHVGKEGDHVCGCDCQNTYDQREEQRRDELYKSTVAPEPHATRRRHK